MLHSGELVPHFTVHTVTGETIVYAAIWQRRNLVLVTLPSAADGDASRYTSALDARASDLEHHEAVRVVTHDHVPGMPVPGVLVADRWGEIACVASADGAADLPAVEELIQWLHYVQIRCAECEGEAK
jgi:hypothetical protein